MQRNFGISGSYAKVATLVALGALSVAPMQIRGEEAVAGGSNGWTLSTHPCPGGNRTDALQLDDDGTVWVGCGTAATGYGLFVSQDGGLNWAAASVTPASTFTQYRASSISRGHDGALYVAGISATQGTDQMVLRVDTSVTPSPVTLVLSGVAQVGYAFQVGNYRELPNGSAIAESLNGYSLLYRPNASTGTSAASWTQVDGQYQILDMTLDQTRDYIIGGGSRIVEPPRIFLPPTTAGSDPWEFTTFALPTATNWEGEIWGVAASFSGIYAVGVDQDTNTGKIFVNTTNAYTPGAYTELSLPDLINPGGGSGTWARGVCAYGTTVVVVGERQPLSNGTGIVLLSTDAGQTFTDVTPAGVSSSVSKCALLSASGDIIVAGSAGFIGILAGDGIFANSFD